MIFRDHLVQPSSSFITMNIYLSETWESKGEIEEYGKEKDNVEERGAQWGNEGWNSQLHLHKAFMHINDQLKEVTQHKAISSAFF